MLMSSKNGYVGLSMQDYSKLPDDLKAKLLKWESNNPVNKQLTKLNDIASILQDISNVIDYQGKASKEETKKLGAVLTDAREQLVSLNKKETPETPDNKPVIEAIKKLESALTDSIKRIDTKPVVNIPKADAPVVNAPNVIIDNKEVTKLLSTLPDAFNAAIKGIPKTESTSKILKELSDKLDSIDVGVRLQPQAPTKIAVTNLDGSPVATNITLTERYDYDDPTTIYTATAPVGTLDASLGWTIFKYDLADKSDSSGKVATDVSWDNRATGSFA